MRTKRRMNGRPLLLSLSLLLLLAIPAAAQSPANEVAASFGRGSLGDFGYSTAMGVSYNRFWANRTSVRFGAIASEVDDEVGQKRVRAGYATAEVHFWRGRIVSPYAGAGVAATSSRIELARGDFKSDETSFAPVVSAGVDFNVARQWAVAVDARWMYLRADLGNRFGPYIIDPLTAMISAKYRF